VGSASDVYNNALVETINAFCKADGPWQCFETVEFAALEWVDWCNNRRLLKPICKIPQPTPWLLSHTLNATWKRWSSISPQASSDRAANCQSYALSRPARVNSCSELATL
jgi:hypothetical protein